MDSANEIDTAIISGHLMLVLKKGDHVVQLQWKKFGTAVNSWTIDSTINGGFAGGRTLVVNAQHQYIWYTQPLSSSVLSDNEWNMVDEMQLSFTLPEKKTVRMAYHVPVHPDSLEDIYRKKAKIYLNFIK